MAIRKLKSIQDIFSGRFKEARHAIVQRCREDNLEQISKGYTEHWPALPLDTELIVMAVGNSTKREIWVGKLLEQQWSASVKKRTLYRFRVDRFDRVGFHDLGDPSDSQFYNNLGGGGARVKVVRERSISKAKQVNQPNRKGIVIPGEMIERMVWIRKNHKRFKDPVWKHWEGKCAVTGKECNGLLVASHIKPWSVSNPSEKTDFHNGLLLVVPLDKLFDSGLIGFSDNGQVLMSKSLTPETKKIFSVDNSLHLRSEFITPKMKKYLRWHRMTFSLE